MRRGMVQLYTKKNEALFSLAWNNFSDSLEVLVLSFLEMKDMVFLSQKVDWNMIFTDYYRFLVFNLFGNGKYGLFLSQKADGIMIFTDYCTILVLTSFGNGKYGLFLSQKGDRNMIFTSYWKVLVLNFSVRGNTVFFWVKKLMERWYFLDTQKFLFWTFRWWEIWSFFLSKSWW